MYRGAAGSDAIDIQQTSDAGFIVLLRQEKLLKLDTSGTILWQKDMSRFSPSAVFEAQAGGYVVIGTSVLVKFNEDGSLDWQIPYYREVEEGVRPEPAFNSVMEIEQDAGGVLALSNIGLVTRFDAEGKVASQFVFDKRPPGGGPNSERVGWTESFAVFAGGFENRNQNWIERYGANSASWRASIIPEDDVPTLNPPFFIRGMRDGGALYASNLYYGGAPQLWLVRLTGSGQIAWQKTYRLINPSSINFLETADGGFLLAGIRYLDFGEGGFRPYLWVSLFDKSGDTVWAMIYGDGTTVPIVGAIAELSEGGFVLAGGHAQFDGKDLAGRGNPMILKINAQGEIPGCSLMRNWTQDRSSNPEFNFSRQTIDFPGVVEANLFEAGYSPNIEVLDSDYVEEQLCVALDPRSPNFPPPPTPGPIDPEQTYRIAGGNGLLLGGTRDGIWMDPHTASDSDGSTDRYQMYTPAGHYLGEAEGGAPQLIDSGTCDGLPGVPLSEFTLRTDRLALMAPWEVVPRHAIAQDPDLQVYQNAVDEYLHSRGLSNPAMGLRRVLRVDLEGDGSDEVVLVAEHITRSRSAALGDYSLILLRRLAGTGLEHIPLAEDIALQVRSDNVVTSYDVFGFFDLNGDGALEIIVKADDKGPGETIIFEHDAQPVLNIPCGLSQP